MTQNIIAPGSWVHLCTCTKSEMIAVALTVGQRHWFRMAGINAGGQGPFSEPVSRIAA
jgi:hypothetical protein